MTVTTARVVATNAATVKIAWDATARVLTVVNGRPLGLKYTNYICRVAVEVPRPTTTAAADAPSLPPTAVIFRGAYTGSLLIKDALQFTGDLSFRAVDTAHSFVSVTVQNGVRVDGNVRGSLGAGFVNLFSDPEPLFANSSSAPPAPSASAIRGGRVEVNTTSAPVQITVPTATASINTQGAGMSCLVVPRATDPGNMFQPVAGGSGGGGRVLFGDITAATASGTVAATTTLDVITTTGHVWVRTATAIGSGVAGFTTAGGPSAGASIVGAAGAVTPPSVFSKTALDRLSSAAKTKPSVGYFHVVGPGAPGGKFMFSTNTLYALFSPTYLAVNTFTLLAPVRVNRLLPLDPGPCPGIGESAVDRLSRVTGMLKTAVKTWDKTPVSSSILYSPTTAATILSNVR